MASDKGEKVGETANDRVDLIRSEEPARKLSRLGAQ